MEKLKKQIKARFQKGGESEADMLRRTVSGRKWIVHLRVRERERRGYVGRACCALYVAVWIWMLFGRYALQMPVPNFLNKRYDPNLDGQLTEAGDANKVLCLCMAVLRWFIIL